MVFKSKVDTWLIIILLVAIGICVVPLFWDFNIVGFIITVLISILILSILFNVKYEIKDEKLIVYGGIYKQTIEIAKIMKLKKSNSALSSPALSMDRIEVIYNSDLSYILISPIERQLFIKQLLEINPNISVDEKLFAE